MSSKVVLSFDIANSEGLSSQEKNRLYKSLAARLTKDKILLLSCEESKSQLQNKTKVIKRFFDMIMAGLFVPKKRLKSKPSKNSIIRMKDKKRKRGDLKKSRRKPDAD